MYSQKSLWSRQFIAHSVQVLPVNDDVLSFYFIVLYFVEKIFYKIFPINIYETLSPNFS